MTGFAAVEIRPAALPAPQVAGDQAAPVMEVPPKPPSLPGLPGLIEVELPTGVRLRVGPDVDGAALRRVLAALGPP